MAMTMDRHKIFRAACALLLIAAMMFPSCKKRDKKTVEKPDAAPPAAHEFVRGWGTDLLSGGNLSGPGAVEVLRDGTLLVLDRFNSRIQSYDSAGRYKGAWGRTPDGKPFPFTLIVDLTVDAADGDVIVGVVHQITDEDMKMLRGGLFRADTFLRFSPDGGFKGNPEILQSLTDSPTLDPDFQAVVDNIFWNRNELLPLSIFGRIAADPDGGGAVWQVFLGGIERVLPDTGEIKRISIVESGAKKPELCDVETDAAGGIYMTGCMHNSSVLAVKAARAREGGKAKVFIDSPAPPDLSTETLTMIDMLRRGPDGRFALLVAREKRIYKFDAAGRLTGSTDIRAPLFYVSDFEYDGRGGYYVADYIQDCVFRIAADGGLLERIGTRRTAPGQFAGRSFQAFSSGLMKQQAPRPAGIIGIAAAPDGSVYVTDAGNRRVQVFGADGRFSRQYMPCPEDAGGCMPADLLYSDGALYVALYGAKSVVKLDARTGKHLAEWRPRPASPTAPCSMCGLGLGPDGSVYATDGESVYKLDAALRPAAGWDPRALRIPSLTNPNDVAVDEKGNIYIAGTVGPGIFASRSAVCSFSPSAMPVKCFDAKTLYHPRSIAAAGGSVFVSNSGRDTLIRFSADGAPIDQWGGEGREDGMFQNPLGLAISSSGDIFVADNGNERIQQFRMND